MQIAKDFAIIGLRVSLPPSIILNTGRMDVQSRCVSVLQKNPVCPFHSSTLFFYLASSQILFTEPNHSLSLLDTTQTRKKLFCELMTTVNLHKNERQEINMLSKQVQRLIHLCSSPVVGKRSSKYYIQFYRLFVLSVHSPFHQHCR
jgi:hypothetical protein